MDKSREILKRYWGFDQFRPMQEQIVDDVIYGHDVLALLPTGGGKSICFQVPGIAREGITLVVSPLIALMQDQVNNLQKRGIRARAITSSMSYREIDITLDNARFGGLDFLYTSPERLSTRLFIDRFKQMNVGLIVVDEAHCISEWGHDFRPSFLEIHQLREIHPEVPVIALTATATKKVREDIVLQLKLRHPKTHEASFTRSNLSYECYKSLNKTEAILKFCKENDACGIVYCQTRKSVKEIARVLHVNKISVGIYHGGLEAKDREMMLNDWMSGKTKIMVATNAFGMGIDKPDVKTVIHIQLPENLENYYQEAGRAGRNGEKAFGIILTNTTDIGYTKAQFIDVLPDKKFVRDVYVKLNNYFQIAYGEGYNESFAFNLNQFCAHYHFPVIATFNSLQFLDRQGIITFQSESTEKISLQFIIPSKEVIRYISLHPHDEPVITTILRTYSGIFDVETTINPHLVAKKAHTTEAHVEEVIDKLAASQCIILHAKNNDSSITFNEVREDDLTINRVAKFLEHQNKLKQDQFQSVVYYISDEATCKNKMLLAYFDEITKEDCGICSYCFSKKKANPSEITQNVIQLLKKEPLSSREIENQLHISSEATIFAIQLLLENNRIKINSNNQYYLI